MRIIDITAVVSIIFFTEENMKLLISFCASILIATVLLSYLPVHGEEIIYENTIRLHVIAESDSDRDQELKLKVRDGVLALVGEKLTGVNDRGTACEILEDMKDEIKCCAEDILSAEGEAREVKVDFAPEEYPKRYYDGYTLPAGVYRSMKILIGEGERPKWWCILFPSVCMSDAVKTEDSYLAAGFTPNQYKVIENKSSKRYKIRFKILEVLSEAVGFDD